MKDLIVDAISALVISTAGYIVNKIGDSKEKKATFLPSKKMLYNSTEGDK